MPPSAATPKVRSAAPHSASSNSATWGARLEQFAARRPRRAWLLAWLAVTICLAAWRWEVLFSPPYWDFAMGLFTEANFLVDTGFDYAALVEQRRFGAGGVATYIISAMPTLVALVMKYSPSVSASLLTLHLTNIGLAALALLLVFDLLRPHLGPQTAALAALVVLTTPLFAAQVDMLGMDMGLTAAALGVAAALLRGRYAIAWLLAGVAFAIKASGMLTTLVMAVFLAAAARTALRAGNVRQQRRCVYWAGAALLLLSAQWGANNWLNNLDTSRSERLAQELDYGIETIKLTRFWCPDLVIVACVTIVLGAARVAHSGFSLFRHGGSAPRHGGSLVAAARASLADWIDRRPLELLGWLTTGGMLAALLIAYTIPRYLLLPLPFLWMLAALGLRHTLPWPKLTTAVLVAVAAVNLLNEQGRFFPSLEANDRTGALLERSREYLFDHRANIEIVRQLERGFADQPIVAGNPFVYFLSMPRLGYLSQGEPLFGYSLNTFSPPTFPDVRRLVRDAPQKPIFLFVENSFTDIGWCRAPRPREDDVILGRDRVGQHPVIVFRRKWAADEAKLPLSRRYRQWLFADQPEMAAELEIETAAQQASAEARLQADLTANPADVEARHNLGVVLARQGKFDAAIDELRDVLRRKPRRAITHCRLADALADSQRLSEAAAAYEEALRLDAELFDAHKGLGQVLGQQGKFAEAQSALERAAQLQPHDEAVWFQLGMSQRLAGDANAARTSFLAALERNDRHAESLMQLGLMDEERGQDSSAAGFYRRALSAKPELLAAANNLAWLLSTSPSDSVRNGKQAVTIAEAVCQHTSYGFSDLMDTLAAAYAEAGRFADAVKTADRAAELALAQGNESAAYEIRQRQALYESQQVYRRPQ